MTANSREKLLYLGGFFQFLADHERRDEIGNNVPSGIRCFRVIRRSLAGGDLSPAADAIGDHFDQQDAPVLDDAKAGFKRRFQRHPDFPQIDSLDLHTCAPLPTFRTSEQPCQAKMHQAVLFVDSLHHMV